MRLVNIYALINPINDSVFYIGVTVQPLDKRLKGHLTERKEWYTTKKADCIREILAANLVPEILLLDVTTIDQTSFYEVFYMDLFHSFGFTLLQRRWSTYSKIYLKPSSL